MARTDLVDYREPAEDSGAKGDYDALSFLMSQTWVQILTPPTSSVTVGKASHLSESYFPHFQNGIFFFPLKIIFNGLPTKCQTLG